MRPLTRKLAHAGLLALTGTLTDAGAQLATGTLNVTRAVLVGLVIGGIGRIAGAVLAAQVLDDATEDQ